MVTATKLRACLRCAGTGRVDATDNGGPRRVTCPECKGSRQIPVGGRR